VFCALLLRAVVLFTLLQCVLLSTASDSRCDEQTRKSEYENCYYRQLCCVLLTYSCVDTGLALTCDCQLFRSMVGYCFPSHAVRMRRRP
jgi:hypothetical protein